MFISLFLISYFTATVTSELTTQSLKSNISGPGDLGGKSVAAPTGTTAETFARGAGAKLFGVEKITDAYPLLIAGTVDAIVYDSPALQYYAATRGRGSVRMVGGVFQHESYGIAVNKGSPLREQISTTVLQLREDGTHQKIREKWFGRQ
jgi:polar amino acid transport system substrate-binding protein